MIVVESKKKSLEAINLDYPDAIIIDMTNQGEGGWIKLSPLYPHGGIPVPFSDGYFSETVEGVWQGLKVFEHEGVSLKPMRIMSMRGINRSGKKLGACLGYQKGMESEELLNEVDARKQIYIPVYEWLLENRCKNLVQKLREYSSTYVVVLLDNETNSDIEDTKKPLSSASLIVNFIVSRLTEEEKDEWKKQAEENTRLSKLKKSEHKAAQKRAVEDAAAKEIENRQKHDEAMIKNNPSQYNPLWLREQIQAGKKISFLQFVRHLAPMEKINKACLSQWYACRFEVDGVKYNSAEQYVMAEKARILGDEELRNQILAMRDALAITELAKKHLNKASESWDKQLFDVAVKGNFAKFDQNETLRNFLLETKDRILVVTNPYDLVWGVGLTEGMREIQNPDLWPGCNLWGFALMEVRDQLRVSLHENCSDLFTKEGSLTSKDAGEVQVTTAASDASNDKQIKTTKPMRHYFKEKPLQFGATFQEQRAILKQVFADTVEIVECGAYETKTGVMVELLDDKAMRDGSVLYQQELPMAGTTDYDGVTSVKVLEQDCIVAAKGLLDRGYNPAVLNLASSWSPGGGVVQGSRAQEESIFRRTNLYRSLYQFAHGGKPDMFATKPEPIDLKKTPHYKEHLDYHFGGIYTPGATVFRATNFELFQKPFQMSFITVAAIKEPVLTPTGHLTDADEDQTRDKIRTIFRIGLKHGHDCLVLGALGCGAYGNPPADVAKLFHEVIEENEFRDKYKMLVFAIIGQKCYLPFKNEF